MALFSFKMLLYTLLATLLVFHGTAAIPVSPSTPCTGLCIDSRPLNASDPSSTISSTNFATVRDTVASTGSTSSASSASSTTKITTAAVALVFVTCGLVAMLGFYIACYHEGGSSCSGRRAPGAVDFERGPYHHHHQNAAIHAKQYSDSSTASSGSSSSSSSAAAAPKPWTTQYGVAPWVVEHEPVKAISGPFNCQKHVDAGAHHHHHPANDDAHERLHEQATIMSERLTHMQGGGASGHLLSPGTMSIGSRAPRLSVIAESPLASPAFPTGRDASAARDNSSPDKKSLRTLMTEVAAEVDANHLDDNDNGSWTTKSTRSTAAILSPVKQARVAGSRGVGGGELLQLKELDTSSSPTVPSSPPNNTTPPRRPPTNNYTMHDASFANSPIAWPSPPASSGSALHNYASSPGLPPPPPPPPQAHHRTSSSLSASPGVPTYYNLTDYGPSSAPPARSNSRSGMPLSPASPSSSSASASSSAYQGWSALLATRPGQQQQPTALGLGQATMAARPRVGSNTLPYTDSLSRNLSNSSRRPTDSSRREHGRQLSRSGSTLSRSGSTLSRSGSVTGGLPANPSPHQRHSKSSDAGDWPQQTPAGFV